MKVKYRQRLKAHRCVLLILLAFGLFATTRNAVAQGPWPRPAGYVFVSSGYHNYATTRGTLQDGRIFNYANDGRYFLNGLNIYYELGLGRGWTLQGTQPFYAHEYVDAQLQHRNIGLADTEVGIRFLAIESPLLVSFRGVVSMPLFYSLDREPLPGYDQIAAQFSITAGNSFSETVEGWWVADAGYRHYFGTVSDQIRYQLLGGIHFRNELTGILQVDGIWSLEQGTFSSPFSPMIQPGYTAVKPMISIVYHISDQISLQAGYYRELFGRNSGVGQGVVLSAWIGLPRRP